MFCVYCTEYQLEASAGDRLSLQLEMQGKVGVLECGIQPHLEKARAPVGFSKFTLSRGPGLALTAGRESERLHVRAVGPPTER